MTLNRVFAILSLLVTVLTFVSTITDQLAPEWSIWIIGLSGAISAFLTRVQGSKEND